MSGKSKKKIKNPYSITVYQGSKQVAFMKYVDSIKYFAFWLGRNGVKWSVMNVYDRKTKTFLRRYYYKDYLSIPRKITN